MGDSYAVTIKSCVRYSPEDWQAAIRVYEADVNTTIGELIAWQKNIFPKDVAIQNGVHIEPMSIVKME